MSDLDLDEFPVEPVKKVSKPKAAKQEPVAPPKPKRIRIYLEENEEIPPTGLFMQLDGVGYVLRPGEEADVPVGLVEILDHATVSIPRMNGDRVEGYRDRARFPYRIIQPVVA